MPDSLPLVTIGMPVYNEGRFIEQSLNSLLAQSYKNCEILISDNASADGTAELCERISRTDERVSYNPSKTNIGAAANFQRVLELASGRYFMWAAGHDLWSENLVSECVAQLEAHPTAAIAFATSNWIDEAGQSLARESGYSDTCGMGPMARFFTVLWGNMHPVLGVIRLDYLRRTRGLQRFAAADLVLLSELALMGDFIYAPGASWSRRQNREMETFGQRMRRYTGKDYGQAPGRLDRWFPHLLLPFRLSRAVWNARIPLLDRVCILVALCASLPARYLAGRR